MGPRPDDGGVVDPYGRVHGTEQLSVVDTMGSSSAWCVDDKGPDGISAVSLVLELGRDRKRPNGLPEEHEAVTGGSHLALVGLVANVRVGGRVRGAKISVLPANPPFLRARTEFWPQLTDAPA
jgi:hypothetical protein